MSIKIAIDAGHGSLTKGKQSPEGYKEHWINVKTAYYCEQYLLNNSQNIETVRVAWNDLNYTDDTDIPLSTRQKIIKNSNCNYSVSIHANAYGNGSAYNNANGVETLISNKISCQKDSLKLAQCIQNQIIKGTTQTNRKVKQQNLAMCNCIAMNTKASCLIEIGFMTNKREADLMKTEKFCKEQGQDIAKGILDYIASIRKIDIHPSLPSYCYRKDTQIDEYRKIGQIHSVNFTGSSIPVTGLFDIATKKQAIKVLQQAMNLDYSTRLDIDGIWGIKSTTALSKHYVKKGERQFMVTALIILLLLHGYPIPLESNPATFTDLLEVVVKQYQQANNLHITGIANVETFKSLIN